MYDYIIVGAGSAGCVLANRLSKDDGRRVLLLEAGPEPTSPWIKIPAGVSRVFQPGPYNWAYTSEPEPELQNRAMYWPRGKVLGGSSAINGMLYVRGNSRDYDDWAQRGNTGWSWSDVLPCYKRGENQQRGASDAHGGEGELSVSDPIVRNAFSKKFIDAAIAHGFRSNPDFNSGDQDGVGFLQYTIKNGSRHSSYEAFVKPILARKNLTIVTEALAEQVAGHPLSEGQRQVSSGAIHWTFGAVAGAVYGAAVELEPKAGAWRGAGFGLALNKLAHGALTADGAIPKAGLPQTGLADPTVGQNIQERQSEWVIHVVFGVVTDSVRRLVRRGL